MKCSLCGAELVQGNNTCPQCGALNMAFMQTSADVPNQSNTSVMPQEAQVEEPIEELETLTPTPAPTATPQVEPVTQSDTNNNVEMPVAKEASVEGEVIDSSNSGFVDLDEGEVEVIQASEDMAAPTLDINNENLTATAQDISASVNVSTYDPTQAVPEDNVEDVMPKEAGINFALPEVKDAEADTQGMNIMEIETKGETVGEESAPVKEKFSLKIFKKKTLPRNLVLILCGVMLVIGVLLGSLLFGNQVYTPGATRNITSSSDIHHVADGNNNQTFVGNFIYKIPKDYDYDKREDGVIVYDKEDKFRVYIKSIKGNYDLLANAKESIKLSLKNESISVSSIIETNVKDHNYLVLQITTGVTNRLVGLRNGQEGYLFYAEIVTADNNIDTGLLELADDIINNTEYNNKYSSMEKIAHEDLSTLIVTISEAKNNA